MSTTPEGLEEWIAELAPRLGIHAAEVPAHVLLEVAREVAHGIVRPGAPVTTFMVGYALGLGQLATPEQGQRIVKEAVAAYLERYGDRAFGHDASDGDTGAGAGGPT